jgi:thymidylate kinase
MRIAFSGTHRSGKSTLLEHVAELLPGYTTVDEPYYLLEEEGYEVAEAPSIDDFEAQLETSIASLEEGGDNVLFDRCPADILAYLVTHDDAESFDVDAWRDRVKDAMNTLDLVVFVPVETRDRIALPSHEDREQRMAVHEKLEELLIDDDLGCDIEVLRVEGNARSRLDQVMARVKSAATTRSAAPAKSRRRGR